MSHSDRLTPLSNKNTDRNYIYRLLEYVYKMAANIEFIYLMNSSQTVKKSNALDVIKLIHY